ncbi:MAG TPA: protein kinase [Pyrinomonadaceae bacterium]|nr:protein kinase [Pyrinomonadaceae bacterium]
MAVAAGTVINQYKIISRLGSGGMGEVYLAQDVRLGRKVALKLLYQDVKQGEDWVRRFEQEARAASMLNHPNIITIYEVGQSDNSHFISTEYIDGQTLRQQLRHSALGLREALEIAIQVATALATAHEAGIIHRDIKPENVMMRSDGYVKVLDFGLAKFVERRILGLSASDPNAVTQGESPVPPNVNTNPGTVMGTVSYMSPEQASGLHVDARSDIFSLGVLLYEMLTGHMPFEGATPTEIVISIIQKRPRPMARFAPDVPLEMERIVNKALSKNTEERYQTIKDMLIDLKRLKRGLDFELVVGDEPEQELSRQLLSGGSRGAARVSAGQQKVSASQHKAQVTEQLVTPTVSSAEYIFKGIARHKKLLLIAAGVIVAALVGYYYYRATRAIDSIAVLPFHSGGSAAEAEDEQIGYEVTKQVINGLSKLSPNLRVVPFNAVHQLKGRSPQEVGREFNVRAVLTIEAKRSSDNLTISTELVDLRDNRLLWGDSPSVKFSDMTLAAQNIIAAVSDHIGLKLSVEDQKKKEVESLYMKGRNAWNKRKADDINVAVGYFTEALKLDQNYAPAYAGLADCYNMLATYGASAPADAFPKARRAAEAALSINNNLSEAHAALAYAKFRGEWDWPGAEREFKEAIRLNPNYASAHQWYANFLAAQRRFEEAEAETRLTQELDRTSLIINSHFGLIYFFSERFDDAIKACKKTIELDPRFFVARRYLGLSYAQKGMYREAVEEFEKAIESSKGSPLMRAEYASVLALNGEGEKARAELSKLEEEKKTRYISAYHIATIYVALKDRDRAFEWLGRAFDERADWLVFINVDPRFKTLRSDPRFTDLLRRMKLG